MILKNFYRIESSLFLFQPLIPSTPLSLTILFRKHKTEIVDELDNLQEALTNFRSEQEDGEEVQLHPFEVTALMNLVIADTSTLLSFSVLPIVVPMGHQNSPCFFPPA